jgi:hypothetical protein
MNVIASGVGLNHALVQRTRYRQCHCYCSDQKISFSH